jgi:hypothetical protein
VFQYGGAASVQEFTGGDSQALWVKNYGANAGLGSRITPRISFSANAVFSYTPYYQSAPFLANPVSSVSTVPDNGALSGSAATDAAAVNQTPTSLSPVGTDAGYAARSQYVAGFGAGASITGNVSKRSTLSASAQLDDARVLGVTSVQTRTASVGFRRGLTRKLSLRLGFGLQDAQYVQDAAPRNRTVNELFDVGVDYGDGMTIGRHYTLGFSTRTSAIRQGNDTQFRLDGSASLGRTIGRTWSTSISASRGTYYVLGFTNPLFSNVVNVAIGGRLAPRLYFSAGAGYMQGESAFSSTGASLVSKNASTKLTFALTPHVGLYAQGSYYQYNVPDGFFSGVAFPQHMNRRSASVGLMFWVPVINQRVARQP